MNRQSPSTLGFMHMSLNMWLGISFLILVATTCKGGRVTELLHLLAFEILLGNKFS